jgi:hypothetical protein
MRVAVRLNQTVRHQREAKLVRNGPFLEVSAHQESEMNISPSRQAGFTRAFSALIVLPSLCGIAGLAFAADTGCKEVFDAMLRLPTVPYHSFTTLQLDGVGKVSSEMINDGKRLYTLSGGKWSLAKMTPQDLIAQEQRNIRNGKTACSVLRDETIDGVSATAYSTVESDDQGAATKSEVWLSKATGLPVHIKMDTPADTRYMYSGVVAPAVE